MLWPHLWKDTHWAYAGYVARMSPHPCSCHTLEQDTLLGFTEACETSGLVKLPNLMDGGSCMSPGIGVNS